MRQTQCAPAPDPRVQRRQHPGQDLAGGAVKQHRIKRVLGGQNTIGVTAAIRIHHHLKRRCQFFQLAGAGMFNKQACRDALKRAAYRVKIARLGGRQFAHHRTAVGNTRDQPLGFKLAQHLAHYSARNAGQFSQFALDQALPRRQLAADDGGAQSFKHLLPERCGGALDVERREGHGGFDCVNGMTVIRYYGNAFRCNLKTSPGESA